MTCAVDPDEADLVLRAAEAVERIHDRERRRPEVMWLAMAEPVSWATMQAASRTLRSVSVMPVSFCESLMKPAGTPVSVDTDRSARCA